MLPFTWCLLTCRPFLQPEMLESTWMNVKQLEMWQQSKWQLVVNLIHVHVGFLSYLLPWWLSMILHDSRIVSCCGFDAQFFFFRPERLGSKFMTSEVNGDISTRREVTAYELLYYDELTWENKLTGWLLYLLNVFPCGLRERGSWLQSSDAIGRCL